MRATSMLISSLFALALVACGGKSAPATTPDPVAEETPQPTETPIETPPDETPPGEAPVAAADAPKNLQVMPKNLTLKQVTEIMEMGIAPALGVKCEFCHDVNDFAADTNEHKLIARKMFLMTQDIAAKNFAGEYKVTCMTCHQGKKEPRTE